MEIRGKILVHKALFASKVGEKGFVSQSVFNIYNMKLYINIKHSYFLKKHSDWNIPFERISNDDVGFVFDFISLDVGMSLVQNIYKPKSKEGWIGPFDLDYDMFTWEEFYASFDVNKLRNSWQAAYSNYDYDTAKILLEVKQKKLKSYEYYSVNDIDSLIKSIELHLSELIKHKDSIDEEEIDNEWFSVVLSQDENDISILSAILEKKMNSNLSLLSLADLEFRLKSIDFDSIDVDLHFAAQLKKEIEKRKVLVKGN